MKTRFSSSEKILTTHNKFKSTCMYIKTNFQLLKVLKTGHLGKF